MPFTICVLVIIAQHTIDVCFIRTLQIAIIIIHFIRNIAQWVVIYKSTMALSFLKFTYIALLPTEVKTLKSAMRFAILILTGSKYLLIRSETLIGAMIVTILHSHGLFDIAIRVNLLQLTFSFR